MSRADIVKRLQQIIYGEQEKNVLATIAIPCRLMGDFNNEVIEVNKYSIDLDAGISKMTFVEQEEHKQRILTAL